MQASEFTELEAPAFFHSEKAEGGGRVGAGFVPGRSAVGGAGSGRPAAASICDREDRHGKDDADPEYDRRRCARRTRNLRRWSASLWIDTPQREFPPQRVGPHWKADNVSGPQAPSGSSNRVKGVPPLLTSTNIRAIASQPSRSLDLRDVMDRRQVLIVNLSKGRLGEDNSMLLGALLVNSIQQAAMTRADVPEIERRDFSLYVDEFQNFTTGVFASVLSEARKYRLSLIVAHQYLTQLDEPTANAVFGNVGSIITFQVGSDDAERLAEQLGKYSGQITPETLTGLPQIHRLRPPLD